MRLIVPLIAVNHHRHVVAFHHFEKSAPRCRSRFSFRCAGDNRHQAHQQWLVLAVVSTVNSPTPCSLTFVDDPNQFHGLAADQLTDDIVEQPVSINGVAPITLNAAISCHFLWLFNNVAWSANSPKSAYSFSSLKQARKRRLVSSQINATISATTSARPIPLTDSPFSHSHVQQSKTTCANSNEELEHMQVQGDEARRPLNENTSTAGCRESAQPEIIVIGIKQI